MQFARNKFFRKNLALIYNRLRKLARETKSELTQKQKSDSKAAFLSKDLPNFTPFRAVCAVSFFANILPRFQLFENGHHRTF